MSASAHEKAAEQEPQPGLPLISDMETKDFASSLCFVVISLFPGFYRRVVQERHPLRTVNEERAVTLVNTCMMSLVPNKPQFYNNIQLLCIDSNLNLWWEQIKGLFQWKVSGSPPSHFNKAWDLIWDLIWFDLRESKESSRLIKTLMLMFGRLDLQIMMHFSVASFKGELRGEN